MFGGPSVPFRCNRIFGYFPFIDVVVKGAGELPFADILERFTESRDFSCIGAISFEISKWKNN